MSESNTGKRVEREARLRWVPIRKMRVSPLAQRSVNRARVDRLTAEFDLEQLGTPTVSQRDEWFYIIDGQHRVEVLKEIGWSDQQVQCWTYEGLTEEDEAEKFLRLNDTLAVRSYAKFKVGVQAGRVEECDIDRIVRAQQLRVSDDKNDGSISCVGTLARVYRRAGAGTLARTLGVIRDAYGTPGLEAPLIDGIGHLCQRYNGDLQETVAVPKLSNVHGGVNGLLGKAQTMRHGTGNPLAHCVAAAAVEIINSGRGGKKLRPYWRDSA